MERVTESLARGHIAAYKIIKTACPNAMIGVAHGLGHKEMTENTAEQRAWKEKDDEEWNWHFLDKIQEHQDFIGINHYFRGMFDDSKKSEIASDLGWEMRPRSLYETIADTWQRYGKPIIITENGCADANDSRRGWFLWESLLWVHKAIEDGIPVLGYFHWSLMDNFEWACGFWPRFGLWEIDRDDNLKRKPRPSAYLYRDIIKEKGFSNELAEKYRNSIAYPKK
ncbi:MAG: family 1 glycosylhydrolase [Candidatus Paceibacterota bacterium]|jgi:beta-glucosidase